MRGVQRDPSFQDSSSTPIDSVRAYGSPFNPGLAAIYNGGCITSIGEVVTPSTKIPAPRAVYVTNKGAQLGMTIEDVLAKHGPPVCSRSDDFPSDRTTYFNYDGLFFTFHKGRVISIGVSSYRPSDRPPDFPPPESCR